MTKGYPSLRRRPQSRTDHCRGPGPLHRRRPRCPLPTTVASPFPARVSWIAAYAAMTTMVHYRGQPRL